MLSGSGSSVGLQHPKDLEFWSEGSSRPLRCTPRRLLVSGSGGKNSWSSERDREFSKDFCEIISLLFSSVSTGPYSSAPPRSAGMNYKAHVLLLRGTGAETKAIHSASPMLCCPGVQCSGCATQSAEEMSPAQLTPEEERHCLLGEHPVLCILAGWRSTVGTTALPED